MKTLSSYKQFAKHTLFEAEEFKAKSKKTGRVVVYKSKDSMDAAIKGGKAVSLDKKKATKQDVDSDMFAQDTWKRGGDEKEPPGKSSGIDDDPFDNLDNMFGDEDEDDLEDPAGGRGDAWMHGPTDDEDDLEDPAGGRGDAWMHGPTGDEEDEPWRYGPFDVVKDKSGEDMFVEPDKKPKKKRPGGKEAEAAYHKADMMMKKYAGVDIPRAEYWAKKKKEAADAMLPEHSFSEVFKRMENR